VERGEEWRNGKLTPRGAELMQSEPWIPFMDGVGAALVCWRERLRLAGSKPRDVTQREWYLKLWKRGAFTYSTVMSSK